MELDEDSKWLTAFSSPASNQRYCFLRLPFGLNVSQDIFQEVMDNITAGLSGIVNIHDDVNVIGDSECEHDQNLHAFMRSSQRNGAVFNEDKTYVKVPEIPFFGSLYSKEGV